MLNKLSVLFFFISFLLVGNSIKLSAFSKDSVILRNNYLGERILSFKYSDQKKALGAIINKQLIVELNQFDNITNDQLTLFYDHIANLLDEKLIEESYELLEFIETRNKLNDRNFDWKYYYWVGVSQRIDSNFPNAIISFNKSLSLIDKKKHKEEFGKILYNKALAYYRNGEKEESLPLLLESATYPLHPSIIFDIQRRISSIHCQSSDYKNGLMYANLAVQSQLDSFAIKTYKEIPNSFDKIIRFVTYGSALQSRAFILREMAQTSPDSIELLNYSLRDAEASIIAFEKYKRNLVFESDLLHLNNVYRYFYYKTIEAISRLYIANANADLFQEALVYSEMDKVSALLRTLQKDVALNESNIPDSLISKHRLLYKQLSEIEAKRYHENANVRIEDEELLSLNLRLYELVTQINDLEENLELSYPKYKEEKYKVKLPNLDFIYDLSKEKSILEYVVSNEKVYAFLINNGEIYFHDFYYRKDFISSIESLQQMISNGNELNFSIEEQKEFSDISHLLYLELIQPFEKQITKKSLLIVPDEQLALIPFEVLLKTKKDSLKSVNYSNLDYLINHFDISYTYSLTLLQKQNILTKSLRKNTIFAMAPRYESLNENDSNQYFTFRDNKKKLGALRGAKEEVENVSKRIKGKSLLNNFASEEAFKKHAGEYSVLHLAMHTLINNENPMYSKLIFTPNVDHREDGMLNTYELSNLHLNADLVVLSACNTGFGKVNKGEGIIGLSRGFFQAGCKSLLATLWSVSDDASTNIIEGFYNGLEQEYSKSYSLSEAKRNYLKNTKGMLAHPFFWAGYISIGNDDPIILAKSNKYIKLFGIIGLSLILLILIICVLYRKEKTGTNSGFQSN
ncbi:MAG: CHAT domain-containing protein [Salinivirgaceae bacterium]|nr:CHAT domain-containing protein [Salinivirgaceae bacterium]